MTALPSTPPRPLSSAEVACRPRPWWRSAWMWLVVAIPAVTLAAAIATTVVAVRAADPPVAASPGERPAHIRQANE